MFMLCITHHRRILQQATVTDEEIDGKELSFLGKVSPKLVLNVLGMCSNDWFCDPKLLL